MDIAYLYKLPKTYTTADPTGYNTMVVVLHIEAESGGTYDNGSTIKPPESVSANIVDFVTRLYDTGLNRKPDQDGMDYWSLGLSNQILTGAKAAENFLISEEIKNKNLSDSEYQDVLYIALMDRTSDAEGKAYWQNFLDNGVSRTGILRQFLYSKEFQDICDTYSITRGEPLIIEARDTNIQLTVFINRQYKEILGRAGDVEGINFWADYILNGASVEEVSKQFVFSKEFTDKGYSQEAFLKILYRAFMSRESDQGGLDYWMGQINAGMSREDVFANFAYSKEFKDIVAGFGI